MEHHRELLWFIYSSIKSRIALDPEKCVSFSATFFYFACLSLHFVSIVQRVTRERRYVPQSTSAEILTLELMLFFSDTDFYWYISPAVILSSHSSYTESCVAIEDSSLCSELSPHPFEDKSSSSYYTPFLCHTQCNHLFELAVLRIFYLLGRLQHLIRVIFVTRLELLNHIAEVHLGSNPR